MRYATPPRPGAYSEVHYYQTESGRLFRLAWRLLTWLAAALLFPLILASKLSMVAFKACSEVLSLIPSPFGFVIRQAFYRFTLAHCGDNVIIDFGTVFYYRDIAIGSNVTFGMGVIVQHCDFGDNVLVADGCRFVGGTRKHHCDRRDVPIRRQGGAIKKIVVGSDTWIDAGCVIMEDVGTGSVVGPGSVVTHPVEPYSVCAGNPAAVIGRRA